MPRTTDSNRTQVNGQLAAPRTLEEHLTFVDHLHASGQDLRPLAHSLVREKFSLLDKFSELRVIQAQLREEIQSLTEPEHYPAVITDVNANGQLMVEVFANGALLEVNVHPDVDTEQLRVGARGTLARSRNCLLHVDGVSMRWNEVGTFEAFTEDRRRILIKHQEQLVAATPTPDLAEKELKKGDLIGFDRDGARLAYARVEPPGKEDLFFESTPTDRFEELGGLDREIHMLKRFVRFRVQHPELVARYKLPAKRGILLDGPPGNGKTKLARCLANFIASLSPAGECRFMAVAGSSDYSMWLGQSEQKIISRFSAARDLAVRGGVPCLMFFDEIDAIGKRRNSDMGSGAPDRILSTLLAQLDGVQQVSNLLVIGATNRADILDSGLTRPGRLGDVKVRIPPPNRAGARAILQRYLANDLPLACGPELMVEGMLSRLYSPKGDYSELTRVTLRDGRKLPVGARDLVSGAMLENVVKVASEEAADREAQGGGGGITDEDLTAALELELRGATRLLTPFNVRNYVTRLPQDIDVVAVEITQ